MNRLGTKTIRQIAVEVPAAARIFEEYQIERTFEEVCLRADASPEVISEKIAKRLRAGGTFSTTTTALSELIEHILESHHVFTERELAKLPMLMNRVVSRHGAKYPKLYKLQKLLDELTKELLSHMLKEELILFPYVIELESHVMNETPLTQPHFGTVNNPVRMLRLEHEDASGILLKIRSIAGGYEVPDGACTNFRALYARLAALETDLHQHMHLENNILFPIAIKLEKKLFLDMLGLV